MNKREFNKRFMLLVAFVVLVIGYIFFTVTPRNAETLKALNSQAESVPVPVDAETIIVDEVDTAEQVKIADDELAVILDELQPHQYHEDPFIEAKTISGLYAMCSGELVDEQQLKVRFVGNNQAGVATDFINYCADAKSRYPILLNLSDVYDKVKQIPANTELGKLLKQDFNEYDPMNPQLYRLKESEKLQAVLNIENSVLLVESTLVFSMYSQYGEILPLSKWLGSQEVDYNNSVIRFAMSKMTCRYQPSEVCSSFGVVSLMFCYEDQSLCGLDFETIYAMTVMPGMQKDVELLIGHLDQFAESN